MERKHKIILGVVVVVLILILAIPAMLIFGVVMWQLGVFNTESNFLIATGWSKLMPLSPSMVYKANGNFEATFMNAVGTSLNITSVSLDEKLGGVKCLNVKVDGSDLGSTYVLVKAGDMFEVTAVCETKSVGDPFDLSIVIEYDQVMGGISTSHTEKGHIRGPVE
ncbi:MAG: hypothetical protein U9Q22_04730 [Candidatus Altiarchaeota archaeon]|nr:hypothetical protein [Candidatus Altiarchaeota archaeon]